MYSENNTFTKILSRLLSNEALSDIDKRQGSVAYTMLACVALELAEFYAKLDIMSEQTFLLTASGKNLENRAFDYGLTREKATNALRIAEFFTKDDSGDLVPFDIPDSSRFACASESDSSTFIFIGKIENHNILKCEQAGAQGNSYLGQIIPITPIANLVEANITGTFTPADNQETDDAFRKRIQEFVLEKPYGGNISDYCQKVNAIEGVGQTKVFPVWALGGSVLLSVVDSTFQPISADFINQIKEELDPTENSGQGFGIAPIGHSVTVTTPQKREITISASLYLEAGYTIAEVSDAVCANIEAYFSSERQKFAQSTTQAIYIARVSAEILKAEGILNVSQIFLDGESEDIILEDKAEVDGQFLPFVKEVELTEG